MRSRHSHRAGLLGAILVASSCGGSDQALRVNVAPAEIPMARTYVSCAGVFAMFPCVTYYRLNWTWTVTLSYTADVGGSGMLQVAVVDATTGAPVSDPAGSLDGELDFVLEPHGRVQRQLTWSRPDYYALPAKLMFNITVRFTDTMGNEVTELRAVAERMPRS